MNQYNQNDNNKLFEEVRGLLNNISLTADEKLSIRDNLQENLPEPQSSQDAGRLTSWGRFIRKVHHRFGRKAIAFAAVLFMLGGLTYAAEGALPGNPLYAVKTHVNEAFINATAFDDSRVAEAQSQLAARRIHELQVLINKDQLTTTTSEQLLNDIVVYTKSARSNIASLESAGEKQREQAKKLRSELTALLATKSKSLQSSASNSRSTSSQKNGLIQQTANTLIAIADENADSANNVNANDPTRSAVTDLFRLAAEELQEVYIMYKNASDVDETPPPQQLVAGAHDLETALDNTKKEDYASAVKHLESLFAKVKQAREGMESVPGTALNKAGKDAMSAASSSTAENKVSTSTIADADADTSSMSPVPTKQMLHNRTIQRILKDSRVFIEQLAKSTSQASTSTTSQKETTSSSSTSSTAPSEVESNSTSTQATSTQNASQPVTSQEAESASSSSRTQ